MLAEARGTTVTVRRVRDMREVARFDVALPVDWMEIAPDESAVLLRGGHGTAAWMWREREGIREVATAVGPRDNFGCGFLRELPPERRTGRGPTR
jgi:hypothetical protein